MAKHIITEHEFFDNIKSNSEFLNKCFDPNKMTFGYKVDVKGSDETKFFFYLDKKKISENGRVVGYKDCFRASYLIGAQWVKIYNKMHKQDDKIEIKSLEKVIVLPKFKNIDYPKMFMLCLRSGLESEEFSKLYDISLSSADESIDAPSLASVLDPLLLSHFLFLVEKLIKNGLKKDYIYCSDNLKKPKGKINIRLNDIKNVITKRYDRVYCNYSIYSEDIPENRIIKKALLFAKKMIQFDNGSGSLAGILKKALNSFSGVSGDIQVSEIKQVKKNKLYREYPETVRLAKMILRRYGYSLSNVKKSAEVPAFWVDMAGLFEHYTLIKLKQKFKDEMVYQFDENTKFKWRPDFLLKKGESNSPMILDSKYKLDLNKKLDADDEEEVIKQLSAYSRENQIINLIDAEKEETIPCVLIYPVEPDSEIGCGLDHVEFTKNGLSQYAIDGLSNFYAVPMGVPMLKN